MFPLDLWTSKPYYRTAHLEVPTHFSSQYSTFTLSWNTLAECLTSSLNFPMLDKYLRHDVTKCKILLELLQRCGSHVLFSFNMRIQLGCCGSWWCNIVPSYYRSNGGLEMNGMSLWDGGRQKSKEERKDEARIGCIQFFVWNFAVGKKLRCSAVVKAIVRSDRCQPPGPRICAGVIPVWVFVLISFCCSFTPQ